MIEVDKNYFVPILQSFVNVDYKIHLDIKWPNEIVLQGVTYFSTDYERIDQNTKLPSCLYTADNGNRIWLKVNREFVNEN